uniref:Uncharacterized protein n=1 Tax=Ixodes ricinus TaxID=34613 RepID=A0A6B0UXB3_IXORI
MSRWFLWWTCTGVFRRSCSHSSALSWRGRRSLTSCTRRTTTRWPTWRPSGTVCLRKSRTSGGVRFGRTGPWSGMASGPKQATERLRTRLSRAGRAMYSLETWSCGWRGTRTPCTRTRARTCPWGYGWQPWRPRSSTTTTTGRAGTCATRARQVPSTGPNSRLPR